MLPSDNEDPVYIQAMSTMGEESTSSALESKCSSPAPEGESSRSTAMQFEDIDWKSHQETLRLEALHMMNHDYKVRIKELLDRLACECLDLNLQGKKSEIWFNQLMELQKKYKELEDKLANCQSNILPLSSDEDIHMRSATSNDGNLSQTEQAESLLMSGMGTTSQDKPMGRLSLMVDIADDKTIHVAAASELLCLIDKLADGVPHTSSEDVVCVAAARNDTSIP